MNIKLGGYLMKDCVGIWLSGYLEVFGRLKYLFFCLIL